MARAYVINFVDKEENAGRICYQVSEMRKVLLTY